MRPRLMKEFPGKYVGHEGTGKLQVDLRYIKLATKGSVPNIDTNDKETLTELIMQGKQLAGKLNLKDPGTNDNSDINMDKVTNVSVITSGHEVSASQSSSLGIAQIPYVCHPQVQPMYMSQMFQPTMQYASPIGSLPGAVRPIQGFQNIGGNNTCVTTDQQSQFLVQGFQAPGASNFVTTDQQSQFSVCNPGLNFSDQLMTGNSFNTALNSSVSGHLGQGQGPFTIVLASQSNPEVGMINLGNSIPPMLEQNVPSSLDPTCNLPREGVDEKKDGP